MPYVMTLDPTTGKQVPYFVTREQFRYQARKLGFIPSRFQSLDEAQAACDKTNMSSASLRRQLEATKARTHKED